MLTPERFTLQKISPLCSKNLKNTEMFIDFPHFSVESPAEDLLLFRLLKGLSQLLLIQLFRFLVLLAEIRRGKNHGKRAISSGEMCQKCQKLGKIMGQPYRFRWIGWNILRNFNHGFSGFSMASLRKLVNGCPSSDDGIVGPEARTDVGQVSKIWVRFIVIQ